MSLAIFASGKGSNAKNLISYLHKKRLLKIGLIVSSHKEAGVIEIAKKENIQHYILDKKEYYGSGDQLIKVLSDHKIDGIVLAGFIWLIPEYLLSLFPHRIINIHPALLPKYGGKGMYGAHVHEAVWNNKESKTGITIHEVNDHYDEGKIIFQASCEIDKSDLPIDIAQKVHQLEYDHYPRIIESLFTKA